MRAERAMPERAPTRRWLSIVGIGEDGVEGLSATARALVSGADIVFGGERHLKLAAPLIKGRASAVAEPVRARHRGGAGAARAARSACSPPAIPSTTAWARCWRAAFRRRRPWWCRRPRPSAWRPRGSAGRCRRRRSSRCTGASFPASARISITAPASSRSPPTARDRQRSRAFSPRPASAHSRMTVLEALGGAHERVRTATAESFALSGIAALNTVAIEVEAGAHARVIPFSAGLDDALFEHDGQITKREIRAVTLSSLAPTARAIAVGHRRGLRLGRHRVDARASLRCAPSPSKRAPIAPPASAATLRRSACRGSKWSKAKRQRLSSGLATPDAIFVGGGASEAGRARCGNRRTSSGRPPRRQCRDA